MQARSRRRRLGTLDREEFRYDQEPMGDKDVDGRSEIESHAFMKA